MPVRTIHFSIGISHDSILLSDEIVIADMGHWNVGNRQRMDLHMVYRQL